MKPLKDIGHPCFIVSHEGGRRQIVGNIVDYNTLGTFLSGGHSSEKAIVLTSQERRELVRAVWEAACTWEVTNKDCLTWDEAAEKFIKEQGL